MWFLHIVAVNMSSLDGLKSRLRILINEFKDINSQFDESSSAEENIRIVDKNINFDNKKRLQHYALFSILKLDFEEYVIENNGDDCKKEVNKVIAKIDLYLQCNRLQRCHNFFPFIISTIVQNFKLLTAISSFMLISYICPFLVVFRYIEELFHTDPFYFKSEKLKRLIPQLMILHGGCTWNIEGCSDDIFEESCSILAFTHASNYDGFIVSGSCPIQQLAFGNYANALNYININK